jgi:hypothetical protein
MTDLKKAAQQALKALEQCGLDDTHRSYEFEHAARAALRAALEQQEQEQEPVAFADRISFDQAMKSGKGHDVWPEAGDYEARTGRKLRVLYTHPPRHEWQSLSEDELTALGVIHSRYQEESLETGGWFDFARAIEAKLKEKNHD